MEKVIFNREYSIQQKNKIQEIAVKGSKAFPKLLLSWATGCGKTLGALKIIKEAFKVNPEMKGYLICKENSHLANWEDDIKEHSMEFFNNISEKFLYASLHKYEDKGVVDFLILDECHGVTDKRLKSLKKIVGPSTRIVYLSATVPDLRKQKLSYHLGGIREYHISISKAIEMGILPHPTLYIHYLQLDDTELVSNIRYKNKYNQFRTTPILTQKGIYDFITSHMEKYRTIWEEDREQWAKNKWVNLGNKRKTQMASFKTDKAFEIIEEHLHGYKRIIFTGSKAQAEEMSPYFVHSGNSNDKNNKLRKDFNSDKIQELSVVNMFRESINLAGIRKGLIIQLDNVKLSFIQMLGRVFRSNIPEMHVMVIKDTQDEKYLETVLNGFDMKYVKEIYHYD